MGNILTIALTYDYWCRHKRDRKKRQLAMESQLKDTQAIVKLLKKKKVIQKYKEL